MILYFDNLQKNDLENEEWRDVVGYEGLYRCSNFGRIKSTTSVGRGNKETILRQTLLDTGYLAISGHKNGVQKHIKVHRAIGVAFIENTFKKRTINHKDKIKINNNLSNLEWATHSEQHFHAYKNGRKGAQLGKLGEQNKSSKKVIQLDKSGNIIREFAAALEAERELGVCSRHIASVCKGKRNSTGGFKWQYA